jgi:hypothetical protein
VLTADGRTRVEADAFAGARLPGERSATRAVPKDRDLRAARRPTVRGELRRMLAAGLISPADHDARRAAYDAVARAARGARGWRRRELAGALRTVEGIAARGALTPSRLALLWLMLERNRAWWTTGPLPAPGARVRFAGSEILWQYFPGQGLHLHPLANFGRLNGLWQGRIYDDRMARLLDELLPQASERAGGLAWEYTFAWAAGKPPWASGMAQATGIQAIARAALRLGRGEAVLGVARRALALFAAPPPDGVAVGGEAGGTHFLLYSFDPDLRVLNGHLRAVIGLHDFAVDAGDAAAGALAAAGQAAALAETPLHDTGAWSLYSRGRVSRESDLGYHRLVRDFLEDLCERTAAAVLCTTGARFRAYESQPVALELRTPSARPGRVARLRVWSSKVSDLRVRIASPRGRLLLERFLARAPAGEHAIPWRVPRRRGSYAIALSARDLAGNRSAVTQAIAVGG